MIINYELPEVAPEIYQIISDPAQVILVESGTKTGKSVGAAIWLLSGALNIAKSLNWWIAPTRKQAKIGFRYMKAMLHPTHFKANETDLSIKLINGSVIECKTGDNPDALYGEAINRLVIDEATRIKIECWNALQTVVAVYAAQILAIANPKGKKNWHRKLCEEAIKYCECFDKAQQPCFGEAQRPYKMYAYYHLITANSPWVDKREIERIKGLLSPGAFNELFNGIPQDNVSSVFSNIYVNAKGRLEQPAQNKTYIIGFDWGGLISQAEKPQNDFGCCVVIDLEGNICFLKRWKNVSFDDEINEVLKIQKRYNNAKIYYDSTGAGAVIRTKFENEKIKSHPYLFTNTSKIELIYGLIQSMEMERIHYPDLPEIINELEAYEHEYTIRGTEKFGASKNYNDDIVTSIALANYGLFMSGQKKRFTPVGSLVVR